MPPKPNQSNAREREFHARRRRRTAQFTVSDERARRVTRGWQSDASGKATLLWRACVRGVGENARNAERRKEEGDSQTLWTVSRAGSLASSDRRFILEQQRLTGIFAIGVALVNVTPHYNYPISLSHTLLNEYPPTSSSQSTAASNKTQEIKRDADRYRDSIR